MANWIALEGDTLTDLNGFDLITIDAYDTANKAPHDVDNMPPGLSVNDPDLWIIRAWFRSVDDCQIILAAGSEAYCKRVHAAIIYSLNAQTLTEVLENAGKA